MCFAVANNEMLFNWLTSQNELNTTGVLFVAAVSILQALLFKKKKNSLTSV